MEHLLALIGQIPATPNPVNNLDKLLLFRMILRILPSLPILYLILLRLRRLGRKCYQIFRPGVPEALHAILWLHQQVFHLLLFLRVLELLVWTLMCSLVLHSFNEKQI